MNHVLKLPSEYSFEKVGIKGKKFPANEVSSNTGFALIETEKGHETEIIERECDFIYYVLDGAGFFTINGIDEVCEKDNLIVIPAGSRFKYTGNLKMLLTSNPAFYPEQEETVL